MQIKFIEEYTIRADGGKTYPVGHILDCNQSTADHFINKCVAVAVEKKTPVEAIPIVKASAEVPVAVPVESQKEPESQSFASQPDQASRRKTLSMSKGRRA